MSAKFAQSRHSDSKKPKDNGTTKEDFKSFRPHPGHPLYKTEMCLHFAQGQCHHGDSCSFAHSKKELRVKPCKDGWDCTKEDCPLDHSWGKKKNKPSIEEREQGKKEKERRNHDVRDITPPISPGDGKKPSAAVVGGPSSAWGSTSLLAQSAKHPNHTPKLVQKTTQIADLPSLIHRVSQLGVSEERAAFATYKVAQTKNLSAGGAVEDTEIIDWLRANPDSRSQSRKPGSSASDDGYDCAALEECAVCMEAEKDTALTPCGHVFCSVCAGQMHEGPRVCPICVCEIGGVLKIFLA